MPKPPNVVLDVVKMGSSTVPTVLSAERSADPDGRIVYGVVQWGDESDDQAVQPLDFPALTHQYAAPGTYDVTLACFDNDRRLGAARCRVRVLEALTIEPLADIDVLIDAESAPVDYDVIPHGGELPYVIDGMPPSGSMFPLGVTRVTVTASSMDGQIATAGFTVTVRRVLTVFIEAPPTFYVPAREDALVITYPEPLVVGGVAPVAVTFTPSAGTPFVVGDTLVVVDARSADGQEARDTFIVTVRKATVPPMGDYFTRLSSRPDCAFAYRFGSQAEIDAMTPRQKPYDPLTQKKRPITYDPAKHAAMVTIHPPESTDSQQLWPKIAIPYEAALLTWDLLITDEFRFVKPATGAHDGSMNRHKCMQLGAPGGGAWLTKRLFYDHAAAANAEDGQDWRIAECVWCSNNSKFVLTPTTVDNEMIGPRASRFYMRAWKWMRQACTLRPVSLLKDYTGVVDPEVVTKWPDATVFLFAYWMGDEDRDMTLILPPTPVIQIYSALTLVRLEWDTGMDWSTFDEGMHYAWHRNLIQLRNPPEDIASLLERPVA